MHDLDTPFDWNGSDNIVIRICWSQIPAGSNNSGQLRINTSTRGYTYRAFTFFYDACRYNPNTNRNYKPHIRFVFQDETEWTGSVSTNWFSNDNWTAGVPEAEMNVNIPVSAIRNPLIDGLAYCNNIELEGELTFAAGSELDVNGDFVNTGLITDLGGTIEFVGPATHVFSNSEPTDLGSVHLNSSAGLIFSGRKASIHDELIVSKGILNTNDSLVINSDATGTGRVAALKTTCTYSISMEDAYGDSWNGGYLEVFEEGVLIGVFSCKDDASIGTFEIVGGNSFTINYTSGSYENENSYEIYDESAILLFSDGPTPDDGEVYGSTATGCSFTSSITGDITMERYIDAGETYWRYFASAVENPRIEQYLDDFVTSGFDGSPYPRFPFTSIYSYDESRAPGDGYVACVSADQVINVGQGYQVWSGDTITHTDPFLVDLVGPVNQGDITLPVTFTASGREDEDGWNMIGNPYPSTIDWDAEGWTKTNMANATYIQDPDTQLYATYVAGASVNGGSRYIASQQSFWVHAIAEDPELTIRESVKSNNDVRFLAFEELSRGVTVQLIHNEMIDEAVIRHVDGASELMEHEYDAEKLWGGWGVYPQVSFYNSEEKDLIVHSFDKSSVEWSIPLRTIVFENGTYELKFNHVFELDVPCLQLEDTYTGINYLIAEGESLSFEMYDTTYAPRFLLHVGKDYTYSQTNVKCFGDDNGAINIDLDRESVTYRIESDTYLDSNSVAGNPLLIADLNAGSYTVQILDIDDLCGNNEFSFTIREPENVKIEADLKDVSFGVDGAIEIEVTGGTAPYHFSWSNGEASQNIYDLTSGEYAITILDANDCVFDSSFSLVSNLSVDNEVSTNLKGFYAPLSKQFIIENEGEIEGMGIINLYGVNGQLIQVYKMKGGFRL